VKKPLALAGTAALLTATIIGVIAVNNASAAVMTYTAALAGSNEVPAVASTLTGMATITIDPTSFQVCVTATINNGADAVIADHIHTGAAGVAGPVLVNFNNNLNTCVTSNATDTANIIANPAGFYFNIHTTAFPNGAARGQLVLAAAVVTTTTTIATATTSVAATATPVFTG
jgi:hypothetical protein